MLQWKNTHPPGEDVELFTKLWIVDVVTDEVQQAAWKSSVTVWNSSMIFRKKVIESQIVLEGTLKTQIQHSCHGQGHLTLDQVSQSQVALNIPRDGEATGFLIRRKKKVIFSFAFFISASFSHNCFSFMKKKTKKKPNFRPFEISSHCPEMISVYTVIKRKCCYYHTFQWEILRDWGCKTVGKKTHCSVWQECDATDCFHVGFCRALWGFGLVALTPSRRNEGSISLKCCPYERSFKSLLSLESQSFCVAG